jgi:hypothetical protein
MKRTTREERLKAVSAKYDDSNLTAKQEAGPATLETSSSQPKPAELLRQRLHYLVERERAKRQR